MFWPWFVEGAGHGAGCGASEHRRAGRAVPDREGSDPGPARSGDLASGAGAHERRSLDGDQLRAALDRAVARPLQGRGLCGPGRPAPAQWARAEPAQAGPVGALARPPGRSAARWRAVDEWESGVRMGGELGLASVCVQRGWEALRAIEWSIQKPRPRHPRADTPEEKSTCKKTRRSRCRRGRAPSRPPGRGVCDRRAPPRPEAGPAPRLGAQGRAPDRARPPPLCAPMSLTDLALALGLPGKIGGHGSEVEGMVERGEIDKVRAYCEGDCLNLFVLYVRWALLTGRTDLEGHNVSLDSLVRCLEAERGECPHLGEFLDRWRATNRPAPMFLPAYPLAANIELMLAAE